MRRYFRTIISILILIPQLAIAQKQNLTTYKYGDSKLGKNIYKNLMNYHDEEIVFSNTNAMIICIIGIAKEGKIDSISTLNDTNSIISKAIIKAVERTKNDWLKTNDSYNIIIPFYIIHDLEDTGNVIINTKDFLPENYVSFPLKGIMLKPIVIRVGPRISYLNFPSALYKKRKVFVHVEPS